jgi:FG-GAP-like repeat
MKKLLLLLSILTAGLLYGGNYFDFNHDGHPDYLLANNSTRQIAIWHMNGQYLVSGVYGPTIPAGWTIVGTGDFNLDGYPDLLICRTSDHQTAVWYLHDGHLLGGAYGPQFINGFVPKAVDDLDNDGRPDILAFNPNTSNLRVILMNNNHIKTATTFQSTNGPEAMQAEAATMAASDSSSTKSPNLPQVGTSEFVLATIPPHFAIVASTNHQLNLINTSTMQTANWVFGFNPFASNHFPIVRSFWGPTIPPGWKVIGDMDFNLDGWNDYLLGGAFGKNAQWRLNGNGGLMQGVYGPPIPTGFSFAQDGLKTCSFGVNPTAKTLTLNGGSFTVNVVTEFGCQWTYQSNTPWIHVSGGTQPRIGGGSIFVTVDPGASGTGTITVAKQTVTITRGGGGVTGHWQGSMTIYNGCTNYVVGLDVHLLQSGSTVTGTFTATNIPCQELCSDPISYFSYQGNVNGTITFSGSITLTGSGGTITNCLGSYSFHETLYGQVNISTYNQMGAVTGIPFVLNRVP